MHQKLAQKMLLLFAGSLLAPLALAQDKKAAAAPATSDNAFSQIAKDFIHDLIEVSKVSKNAKGARSSEVNALIKKSSDRIDYMTLSKKCLGPRWTKLSAPQRKEFADTLQKLLEEVAYPKAANLSVTEDQLKRTYVDAPAEPRVKINGEMEREKRGEMVLEKVEISLIFDKKSKKIVDTVFENENVTVNLRRQFDEAFKTKSFAQIIDKMKKRTSKAQGIAVEDDDDKKAPTAAGKAAAETKKP